MLAVIDAAELLETALDDDCTDELATDDELELDGTLLDATELDDFDELLNTDEELLDDKLELDGTLLDTTELDDLDELLNTDEETELATDEEVTTTGLDEKLDELTTEDELATDDELTTTGADDVELLISDEDELVATVLLKDEELTELLLVAADDCVGVDVEPPPPPQPERKLITERLRTRELTRITNLVIVILEICIPIVTKRGAICNAFQPLL